LRVIVADPEFGGLAVGLRRAVVLAHAAHPAKDHGACAGSPPATGLAAL
jgi:hypothetical protein